MIKVLSIIIFLIINIEYNQSFKILKIYYEVGNENIGVFDFRNLNDAITNSKKAYYIQFYAYWCTECQGFAHKWSKVGKETKPWHNEIISIGVVDCGSTHNTEICEEQNIEYYPTFHFFQPRTQHRVGIDKGDPDLEIEELVTEMITFVENQNHLKENWPVLAPFNGDLETLFEVHSGVSHVILVFESNDSFLGRKLALDFFKYRKYLIIRRVINEQNPKLYFDFSINPSSLPLLYAVTLNNRDKTDFEKLESVLDKLQTNIPEKLDESGVFVVNSIDKERTNYAKLVAQYIKYHLLPEYPEMEL